MMDDNGYVALSEKVTATFYDDEHEEWTQKTMTIADVLDSVCDDYTVILSAQPETYKEKLKEIADALSEKFAYMNTCLNERDIILGYLGVKRPSKTHCNTDCTNIKCESYCYNKRLPSAQPEIKTDNDTISRQAAICAVSDACFELRGVFGRCEDALKALPSTQSKRKTGRWILSQKQEDLGDGNYRYICSECSHEDIQSPKAVVPFCWYCGSPMLKRTVNDK